MKTTTRTKTQKSKKRNTRPTLGSLAIASLEEAIAFEKGADTGATVRKVTVRRATAEPAPEIEPADIARIREALKLSQPLFAEVLNVSPGAVKAWEQGMNAPGGAALRLLQIAESHPEVILEQLGSR